MTKSCQSKLKSGISFSFHNVGQGLFYSGEIGEFKFIYDCGADTKTNSYKLKHLNSVVKKYVNHIYPSQNVDLLILSHLHEDHISGLDELFNNGVAIDTVILPYLTPIERLMVALRRVNLQPWFYQFWSDPVTFLIEKKGVKRIILVGGREEHYPEDVSTEGENFKPSEKKLDFDEMPDDNQLKKNVAVNDPQLQRFFKKKNLFTKNHNGNLKAFGGMWIFRFFNYKMKDSKQKTFEKCVKRIIKNKKLDFVIKSKPLLRQLKVCYKLLGGDFNNTSLVVYHGPTIGLFIKKLRLLHNNVITSCFGSSSFCDFSGIHAISKVGHLLTGDINLNKRWRDITRHYSRYFSRIAVVLVPHHGSRTNWRKSILLKIPQPSIWIVSAGITNKYKHPNFGVMQDIIQKGDIPFFSNELHEIRICIT